MKIGIDLRSLEDGQQYRGIGRYATDLIEEIGKIDKKNHYIFLTSSKSAVLPVFDLPNSFKVSFAHGKGKGLRRTVKFIRTLHITPRPLNIDKYKLDVFFQLDIQQPVIAKKTPVVPVLYDLIPFLHKEIYQHLDIDKFRLNALVFRFRHKMKWYIAEKMIEKYKDSKAVISISEYSKNDLIKFLPDIQPDKIYVTPLAVSHKLTNRSNMSKRIRSDNLKSFLFYVGGADPRKGLVNLVKNMEDVWKKNPEVQLVLAGKEISDPHVPEARRLAEAVRKSSNPTNVLLYGYVEDNELSWLYSNALAFVFPSIYEGFGLPVLEAMQAGCPVIVYDNTSIPEAAGNAAILVKDGLSFAPDILKIANDENLRLKLKQAGKLQAKKFNWHKTASKTIKVLTEVGNKS